MGAKKSRIWIIILSVLLFCFSILTIFSVASDTNKLVQDYEKLYSSDISFVDLFRTDVPEVSNPVGPFGVIVGYQFNHPIQVVIC